MDESKTEYKVPVECRNCNYGSNRFRTLTEDEVHLTIPMGKLFENFSQSVRCANCGRKGTFKKK